MKGIHEVGTTTRYQCLPGHKGLVSSGWLRHEAQPEMPKRGLLFSHETSFGGLRSAARIQRHPKSFATSEDRDRMGTSPSETHQEGIPKQMKEEVGLIRPCMLEPHQQSF